MTDNRRLEDLGWNELVEAMDRFITADGPNTDDLSIADFFALWAQFDGEREQRANIAQTSWEFSL